MLTPKERWTRTLAGQPVDRFPVAAPYIFLTQIDHWVELTGQPAWTYYEWLLQEPGDHVHVYADYLQQLPFDLLQPHMALSRERRETLAVIERDGKHYYQDRRSGELTLLNEDLPHAQAVANQTRRVFDRSDVRRVVAAPSSAELLASGRYDFIQEAGRTFGDEMYLLNGVTGTFWQCTFHVGETNLFPLLYDDPVLIEALSARLLEKTIEEIRALAASGVDAIYIDDAVTTSDMISVAFYERFSLPYVRAMVEEIHALGKKAVLIYFGGVADRLAQIGSLGADALSVETSMKAYTNDLGEIAGQLGDRLCLWGNIDPVGVVQDGAEEELAAAVREQVAIGRRLGRFIVSTGSPITPLTPLSRIRRFIELGRELGQHG